MTTEAADNLVEEDEVRIANMICFSLHAVHRVADAFVLRPVSHSKGDATFRIIGKVPEGARGKPHSAITNESSGIDDSVRPPNWLQDFWSDDTRDRTQIFGEDSIGDVNRLAASLMIWDVGQFGIMKFDWYCDDNDKHLLVCSVRERVPSDPKWKGHPFFLNNKLLSMSKMAESLSAVLVERLYEIDLRLLERVFVSISETGSRAALSSAADRIVEDWTFKHLLRFMSSNRLKHPDRVDDVYAMSLDMETCLDVVSKLRVDTGIRGVSHSVGKTRPRPKDWTLMKHSELAALRKLCWERAKEMAVLTRDVLASEKLFEFEDSANQTKRIQDLLDDLVESVGNTETA